MKFKHIIGRCAESGRRDKRTQLYAEHYFFKDRKTNYLFSWLVSDKKAAALLQNR